MAPKLHAKTIGPDLSTALQDRRQTMGAHPLLKLGSFTGDIYNTIKLNPGITVLKLAKTYRRKYYTVKEAVGKLKREGLVIDMERVAINGRVQSRLRTVTEAESNYERDKLKIDVIIYVNDMGEYSAEAHVANESPFARGGNPRPIHTVSRSVMVPRPHDPTKTRQIIDQEYAIVRGPKSLTIDGTVLKDQGDL